MTLVFSVPIFTSYFNYHFHEIFFFFFLQGSKWRLCLRGGNVFPSTSLPPISIIIFSKIFIYFFLRIRAGRKCLPGLCLLFQLSFSLKFSFIFVRIGAGIMSTGQGRLPRPHPYLLFQLSFLQKFSFISTGSGRLLRLHPCKEFTRIEIFFSFLIYF